MEQQQLIDELIYINYAHNRGLAPEKTPAQWKMVYGAQTDALEARYQAERKQPEAA